MRNRGSWTTGKLRYLEQVRRVLDELEDYWPLTLRQVYYQLVEEATKRGLLDLDE